MNLSKIGERIQSKRKQLGMSINDLAEATSITPKSITLIEQGQAKMDIECLVRLCTTLDMTPNQILSGEYRSSKQPDMELLEAICQREREAEEEEAREGIVKKDDQTVLREIRQLLEKYNNMPRASYRK